MKASPETVRKTLHEEELFEPPKKKHRKNKLLTLPILPALLAELKAIPTVDKQEGYVLPRVAQSYK